MSNDKDKKPSNKLTPKQELFVQELAKGKSQRQAYFEAYPKSKNWKVETVDAQASKLANNNKVLIRLEELRKVTEKKVEWTRIRALNEINYVLEKNKADIERQDKAYDMELEILEGKLIQLTQAATMEGVNVQFIIQEMNEINEQMVRLRQKRRVSAVNTNGILNAAKVLNRMFGYDITKVEINQKDEERENMKALSKEELRAIAYANIRSNGSNTDKS